MSARSEPAERGRERGRSDDRGGEAVLELRDVHRTHGAGEAAVHALRGVSLTSAPVSWSP